MLAPPAVVAPSSTEAAPPSTDAELRELALKRLKKRQDFRAHRVVYVVVNAFLWALWAWDVYGRKEITAADVEREMERLRAD